MFLVRFRQLLTDVRLFELQAEAEEVYLFVETSADFNKYVRGYKCDALKSSLLILKLTIVLYLLRDQYEPADPACEVPAWSNVNKKDGEKEAKSALEKLLTIHL